MSVKSVISLVTLALVASACHKSPTEPRHCTFSLDTSATSHQERAATAPIRFRFKIDTTCQ